MLSPQFLSIFITLVSLITYFVPVCCLSRCLEDQKILLLNLKVEFRYDPLVSTKLVTWNEIEDCCSWEGVGCDDAGHVINLELDSELIFASLENSTSLFTLSYLEKLNLALNEFNDTQIPRRLSNLKNLTHLNLSMAFLFEPVSVELSTMTRLVSLDLSRTVFDIPDLTRLVQNLTELRELYLDGVHISAQEKSWCQVLSSSLPNLRELSLCDCYLSGPMDSSLSQLHSLSILRLDHNNLSTTDPRFFANFSKLTTLSLVGCSLRGFFPRKIFQVPTLQNLDLSGNALLSGTLPQFPQTSALRTMVLSYTNFSDSLPDSIGNLTMLSSMDLSACNFRGKIPSTMTNLTELIDLDLSSNFFTGSIPHFHMCKKLTNIALSYNQLTGSLPSSLFVHPSLQYLWLSDNQFDGQIEEIPNPASSQIVYLDLSSNKLEGRMPKFLFKLKQLESLFLSFNLFSGTLHLEIIRGIRHLTSLALSHNNLAIDLNIENSNSFFFPDINTLELASCKLKEFPETLKHLNLSILDLSANQLKGKIPAWIWEINNGLLGNLNLSFNQLTGFEEPYSISRFTDLDLSFNQLHGELPIPPNFGNYLHSAEYLYLSSNNFTGVIPTSICMYSSLEVLDLFNNSLNGSIPYCLTNFSNLVVLNLGMNRFSGNIPNTFSVGCSLNSLYLNQNLLTGKFPGSLVNCSYLEVLDIANNRIEDTFPCMLMNTNLRVLVLRSNKFHGELQCPGAIHEWPKLQIIDISVNNFTGALSPSYFSKWQRMMNPNFERKWEYDDYASIYMKPSNLYYEDTLTVMIEGLERELKKIFIAFTVIDFSSNKLNGKIPDSIGDLKSLYLLNLSTNDFTETIPASIGNLTQLGSLDLSMNLLTGKIPEELASLTFLQFLNLSFNGLSGPIPSGPQLNTFLEPSYKGNAGLCGFPLSISCKPNKDDGVPPPKSKDGHFRGETEIDWVYIFVSLGFATGLGIFSLPLLLSRRWRERYFDGVDSVLLKIFHKQRRIKRSTAARVPRHQIRRL